jgi:hypothetical protein
MMQTFDPVCLDALARLLARPDPSDLPPRIHVYRCEGDPDRRVTRLPGILMGWLQRRHLEIDIDEPLASATRTLQRGEHQLSLDRRRHQASLDLRTASNRRWLNQARAANGAQMGTAIERRSHDRQRRTVLP